MKPVLFFLCVLHPFARSFFEAIFRDSKAPSSCPHLLANIRSTASLDVSAPTASLRLEILGSRISLAAQLVSN